MNTEKKNNSDIPLSKKTEGRRQRFIPGKTPIPVACAEYGTAEIDAVMESLKTGWLGFSQKGREFESAFAARSGHFHSVFVNSGSSANLLALDALKTRLGLKEGEIITPALTFPTTFNPIIQLGFTPVLVDIDDTLNICIDAVSKAAGPNSVGIIVPHILGNPARIENIMEIADKKGLFVLEDCCSALGSRYLNRKVGTFGNIATYSFYAAHGMTTGEGGAVCTDNAELHRIVLSKREWGRDPALQGKNEKDILSDNRRFKHNMEDIQYDRRYIYSDIGYNMKPLELQAAFGLQQLKRLPDFDLKRIKNTARYQKHLENIRERISMPAILEKAEPVFMGLPLMINDTRISRSRLLSFLVQRKIDSRVLFAGNISKQPAYRGIQIRTCGNLKNTDNAARYGFWLGVHPAMTAEMIDYVCSTLSEYCLSIR